MVIVLFDKYRSPFHIYIYIYTYARSSYNAAHSLECLRARRNSDWNLEAIFVRLYSDYLLHVIIIINLPLSFNIEHTNLVRRVTGL